MSQTTQSYFTTVVKVSESTRKRLLQQAQARADKLGAIPGSIENGDGNKAGIYGELVLCDVIGGEREDTLEYDIRLNGFTIDVKTKCRSVPVKPTYEAQIPTWNTDQNADLYYFVSVRTDAKTPYKMVDFCGYIDTDKYYDLATYRQEGEPGGSGFHYKTDCYTLEYQDLNRKIGMKMEMQI